MEKFSKTKTSLRPNAYTSLKTVDLIHPNENSNLPGYGGYTAQLKFNCGHTYGYQTDKLSKVYPKKEKHLLARSLPDYHTPQLINDLNAIQLDSARGEKKYVENMVPGYTGFVPQHWSKYGKTYKEGTEEAIKDFASHNLKHRLLSARLRKDAVPSLISNSPLWTGPLHPGVDPRYAHSITSKIMFGDKRPFSEAPIPGYQGYVPLHEKHNLGSRYGFWTRNAYLDIADAVELTAACRKNDKLKYDIYKDNSKRYGTIYNPTLGMVPHYTGYVPQYRYKIGGTYGDISRELPICRDTQGYAEGLYRNAYLNNIKRVVIPVRN